MKNILFLFLIIAVVIVGAIAEAQQMVRVPTIGWLEHSSPNPEALRLIGLFRKGLRDAGYV